MNSVGLVPVAVIFILLLSPTLNEKMTDDDDIDPFDMLNFDHASMSMGNKKVKKDIPVDKKVEELAMDKKETNEIPSKKETNEIPSLEKQLIPPAVEIKIPHESLTTEKPSSVDQPEFDLRKCPIKKSPASPLFRQFVKTFLNHISNKVLCSGEYDMRLKLTVQDIEILRRYGDSETEVDIYTAHTVLTGMIYNFREVSTDDKSGRLLWIEEQLGFPLEKLVQMVIVVVLLAGICALFIHLKFSVKQLFIIVFVFLFFTSWLLTWYTLCKKEMSKQHYIISRDMPEYCKSRENQDAGLLSVTFSWLASPFRYEKDECLEYFENLIINPFIKVSPVEALAVTLTRFTVAPLTHIAEELSKALRMFLKDLPVHIAPIAMIGLSVFGFLFLFMGFGYRVSSFLLTIGPGDQKLDRKLQALEEKNAKQNKEIKDQQEIITEMLQKSLDQTSQVPAISQAPNGLALQNHGDATSHSSSLAKSTSNVETIPNIDSDSQALIKTVANVANSGNLKDSNKSDSVKNKNGASAISAANINGKVFDGFENGDGDEIKNRRVADKNASANDEHGSVLNKNGDGSGTNVNGGVFNKNENVNVSNVNENGAVSEKNEPREPSPVQCTDNHLNSGIEETKQKKSTIPVIKKNNDSSK